MNHQEMFNSIILFARKQNAKGITEEGRCMYRGYDGTKCFIGHLIPDDLYEKSFEGSVPVTLLKIEELAPYIIPDNMEEEETLAFLEAMQSIHDDFDVEHWETQFQLYAEENSLTVPKPDNQMGLLV